MRFLLTYSVRATLYDEVALGECLEPFRSLSRAAVSVTVSASSRDCRGARAGTQSLGSFAKSRHTSQACVCNALSSLGLMTVVHPAATAEASLAERKDEFAFQGLIRPATPDSGLRHQRDPF